MTETDTSLENAEAAEPTEATEVVEVVEVIEEVDTPAESPAPKRTESFVFERPIQTVGHRKAAVQDVGIGPAAAIGRGDELLRLPVGERRRGPGRLAEEGQTGIFG